MYHKVRELTSSLPLIIWSKLKAIFVLAWTGHEVPEVESFQISRKSAHANSSTGTSRYSVHQCDRKNFINKKFQWHQLRHCIHTLISHIDIKAGHKHVFYLSLQFCSDTFAVTNTECVRSQMCNETHECI
jgi:hypothetical protein